MGTGILIFAIRDETDFVLGGIVRYAMPPPDLPGSANVTLLKTSDVSKMWTDSSILSDGNYGVDVMKQKDVPNYGKYDISTAVA